MYFSMIMRVKDLGVPVGLIAGLVGVFYCFGVFEVQDSILLPREPDRSQIAPAMPVAALPPHAPVPPVPQAPAPTAPQPEKAALVALEAAPAEKPMDAPLTPLLAERSTPSATPAQTQLLYGAAAADSAHYLQQTDELLPQATESSEHEEAQDQAELQAQDPGAGFDPSAAASDAIEQAQQFVSATVQDDVPQQ